MKPFKDRRRLLKSHCATETPFHMAALNMSEEVDEHTQIREWQGFKSAGGFHVQVRRRLRHPNYPSSGWSLMHFVHLIKARDQWFSPPMTLTRDSLATYVAEQCGVVAERLDMSSWGVLRSGGPLALVRWRLGGIKQHEAVSWGRQQQEVLDKETQQSS